MLYWAIEFNSNKIRSIIILSSRVRFFWTNEKPGLFKYNEAEKIKWTQHSSSGQQKTNCSIISNIVNDDMDTLTITTGHYIKHVSLDQQLQQPGVQLCVFNYNWLHLNVYQETDLAACCGRPGRRLNRHVVALHDASCPCTARSLSRSRLVAACRGWRQRRTAQSKSTAYPSQQMQTILLATFFNQFIWQIRILQILTLH